MKPTLLPKTKIGKISLFAIILFILFFSIFLLFVKAGERGGKTFFSNLKLSIPFSIAALSASLSFFTGIYSIIKRKESSALVFLSTLISFLIFLWILAEIFSSH